ncbi:hypothetical protein GCM10011399_36250 [Subtercola lobariae]|uniref:Uncharacterized protein n=1 Tax=Subtercola lobariae TaxID=1588641 RepID=A0A917BHJ4_9MICO|nr:hypothetical protein GCM10011399_36250 [Subtercola lobariae]
MREFEVIRFSVCPVSVCAASVCPVSVCPVSVYPVSVCAADERTPAARMADSISAMVDDVVVIEAEIAEAFARRASAIERVRQWTT